MPQQKKNECGHQKREQSDRDPQKTKSISSLPQAWICIQQAMCQCSCVERVSEGAGAAVGADYRCDVSKSSYSPTSALSFAITICFLKKEKLQVSV